MPIQTFSKVHTDSDAGNREFFLSRPNMQCAVAGTIYSVNHGNFFQFHSGVQQYTTLCKQKQWQRRVANAAPKSLHQRVPFFVGSKN